MTKLPPGFSHEVRHHLTRKAAELDPVTGVPILPLGDFCCGSCAPPPITVDYYQHLSSRPWLLRSNCVHLSDGRILETG
jgi:hypothetical protein